MKNLRIQYLRAFAALAVVLFHAGEAMRQPLTPFAAGVDVFFVVSGFIMWITTAGREKSSPAIFGYRRLVRVAPLYWLATIATAVAARTKPSFFFGVDPAPATVVRSLLFAPPVRGGALRPVVIQGWTLTYELFFYALFAVALAGPRRWRLSVVLTLLLGLVAVHPFAGAGYAAALTSPLLLEFAAGVAIGAAWNAGRGPGAAMGRWLWIAGAAALAAQLRWPLDLPRVVAWGAPAAAIVAGAAVLDRHGPRTNIRVLRRLGDASYSVYLWHGIAAVVVGAALMRAGVPGRFAGWLAAPIAVALTLLIYRLLERPLNERLAVRRRETLGAAPEPRVSTAPATP